MQDNCATEETNHVALQCNRFKSFHGEKIFNLPQIQTDPQIVPA